MDENRFAEAARCLRGGGIVAYPTEAVWGLGCDPFNEAAVRRLLALKARPASKGLIVLAADQSAIEALVARLGEDALRRLDASWPGPTTWLLPDPADAFPRWVKGDHDSVAVRVSAHPVAAALATAFGGAIVSTSANKAGMPPALTAQEVAAQLGDGVDVILAGERGGDERPSAIRDVMTGARLR